MDINENPTNPNSELVAIVARYRSDADVDAAIANIAVALERAGAAEGAYTLAWKARQRLYGFFAAVILLAIVLAGVWLVGNQTARQVNNTGKAVENVAIDQDGQEARIIDLERRLTAAEAVRVVAPPAPAAAVPPAPVTSALPNQAEAREPTPTEAPSDGSPAAAHSGPSTPPDTTLPTTASVDTTTP